MGTIFIPFVAALITGTMAGAVVLTWAWALKYPEPFLPAAIVAALAMVMTWLYGYDRARRVSEIERGVIADPPPAPLPPQPPMESATVLRVSGIDLTAGDILRFGLDAAKLQALALGLVEGRPLTQTAWQGVLTRAQVAAVQSEFLKFGYCRWRSPGTPARGVVLTAKGEAVCRGLAGKPTPSQGWKQPI